jgi:glycosyltransferase involved in cell wall biosynthesis
VTPRRIRVLHVLGALSGGGIQNVVLTLLRHRDRDRFDMDVCAMATDSGPLTADVEALGCRVYTCPLGSSPHTFAGRFGALLRDGRYDALHVSRSSSLSAFPLLAASRAGVPVRVAHYHNVFDARGAWSPRRLAAPLLRRLVLAKATHVLGVSGPVLESHFGARWADDPRLAVMPNPVDLSVYTGADHRDAIRAGLGIPAEAPVIGHSARFSEAKNHKALLEVAAALGRDLPNLHWLLVGDGPLRPAIEERARALGLTARIHFTGWRDDVPDLLSAMDLFFFPSLWEGFGLALVEAQAAGLPCVASDLPCFREVLHPALWDRRFPLHNLSIADKHLRELLLDPGLRRQLGALAREHVTRFDAPGVTRRFEAIYTGTAPHQ